MFARALCPLICLLAAPAMAADRHRASRFETEPTLAALELVAPALLAGPGFRIEPQVAIVGFMARFTLVSDHGPITADSIELLEVRAQEMAALDVLATIEQHQAFGTALQAQLDDKVEVLARIVSEPVATVTGLPAGALRYFRKERDKWGDRLRRHGDRIAHKARSDGDPYTMSGPMNAGRDARPKRPRKRWYTSAGKEVVRQVEDAVSHGSARRLLARRLGIDPYTATTNPVLNARLDRLAWGAAGGSMTVDEALGFLPTGGETTLGYSGRLNELVWQLEPEDLRRRNRAELQRWCGDEFQIRRFVRHGAFLASVQTRFVDAMSRLAPRSGCEDVLDLALGARHDVEARFLANALALSGDWLGAHGQEVELQRIGAGLAVAAPDGRLVVPLPVDYLSWTEAAAEFFAEPAFRDGARTVLVSGRISPRALRELTILGWNIVERAPYATSAALRSGTP